MKYLPDTQSRWGVFYDYLRVVAGAVIIGVSIDLFLVPNNVVSGGITGLAILINHLTGVPVGVSMLVLNTPLLWLGWRYSGGPGFLMRTIVGVVVLALSIDLLAPVLSTPTEDRLLVIFYGGAMGGLGLALVFRGRGTTGGVDILGQLANRFWGWDIGQAMLAVNILVFGLAGLLFGPEPAMVALLLAFVTTKSLDAMMHGLSATRSALIISDQHDRIRESVLEHLGRGVTVLHATGGYTGEERKVLYVVVQRHEAQRLRQRIHEADPGAFVSFYSPQEVMGGFPQAWRS
jgi:uncharacterized membrane-anchored protein YitT (DUF2179 family)